MANTLETNAVQGSSGTKINQAKDNGGQPITSTVLVLMPSKAKRTSTLVRGVHGGNFWKKIEHPKIPRGFDGKPGGLLSISNNRP